MGPNQYNPNRDADRMQGTPVYEMDFQSNIGTVANVGDKFPQLTLRVAPHLPYRKLYISLVNTANTTSDVTGTLAFYYQRKLVYQMRVRFFSGTAPTTVTATGGILMPNRASNAIGVADSFVVTRIGTTTTDTIPPHSLFVTCDEITFTPEQETTGGSGLNSWVLACKSAAGPLY